MSEKITAIYERVSTTGQDHAAQHGDLARWAEGKDYIKWFRDKFTGHSMDRPGMNKLMDLIREGKVKTVVCWRLDRLGRTALGLHKLFEELNRLNVNLVSLKDGIDLSSAAGRMMAGVLSSVAVFESEIRAERQKAGIAAKRERVKKGLEAWNMGRPVGTRHKTKPEVVKQIVRMKAEKTSVAEIARVLGLSRQTVYSVLKEESK